MIDDTQSQIAPPVESPEAKYHGALVDAYWTAARAAGDHADHVVSAAGVDAVAAKALELAPAKPRARHGENDARIATYLAEAGEPKTPAQIARALGIPRPANGKLSTPVSQPLRRWWAEGVCLPLETGEWVHEANYDEAKHGPARAKRAYPPRGGVPIAPPTAAEARALPPPPPAAKPKAPKAKPAPAKAKPPKRGLKKVAKKRDRRLPDTVTE